MRWLKSILREVVGLFVDDGSFAIAILVWLVLAVVALPHVTARTHWTGPILFVGLALVLVESVMRFSRRRRK